MNYPITFYIALFIVFLYSVILHEIAHGVVAEWFGDDTARMQGRITLNPISHIDPYMSILLPAMLLLFHSPVLFGGARPVPVNYYRLNNYRWGVFWVSVAGVITNFFLAFALTLPLHWAVTPIMHDFLFDAALSNIVLVVVNLIPIPPLDGSKALAALLGTWAINKIVQIEMRGIYGILPFFIVIYFLFYTSFFQNGIYAVAGALFHLFGIS